MKSNYKIVHHLIHENSWKVREVYCELLKELYDEKGIELPDKNYSNPENYFNALFELVQRSGDLTEIQISRIKQVYTLLSDNECSYYVDLVGEKQLQPESDSIKTIVLQGADIYHTMSHNLMVASYLLLLKIIEPERYNISGNRLEIAVLTALFHDSVQSSDAQKEMATWDESAVVAVLDQVYNPNTRKIIVEDVLEAVRYTDYSNPRCPFYVDFSDGSSQMRVEWERMPLLAQMIVIADWLGQTIFAERRSRNIMTNHLYQYWLVATGNDKTHEFPIKISIFRAVIECLLQMPEHFFIKKDIVNDIRDEIIYFHDSKPNISQCFNSKREIYEMDVTEALRMMHSYLSKEV